MSLYLSRVPKILVRRTIIVKVYRSGAIQHLAMRIFTVYSHNGHTVWMITGNLNQILLKPIWREYPSTLQPTRWPTERKFPYYLALLGHLYMLFSVTCSLWTHRVKNLLKIRISTALRNHFEPKRSVVTERFHFHK